MSKEVLLHCKHMFKSFGPTKALVDVELEVNRGEIRGLIGENGSGKSTISSIVAGVQPYDSGEMFFKGEPYKPTSMIEAQAKGIAMVVQEMGTISNITVAANIFIGKETSNSPRTGLAAPPSMTKHPALQWLTRCMKQAPDTLLFSLPQLATPATTHATRAFMTKLQSMTIWKSFLSSVMHP